ncbi:MAG: hypothetical protein DMG41_29530 [Acidobacteria bacterium]|nr:MAG: hypothetical protein AUH13_27680 [Acidobacteria bacterium 13_2_20CM_58_27]PYT83902.1 MAG: hypothetical protein DMG41_29530 [Acidobacteriota bacterium]
MERELGRILVQRPALHRRAPTDESWTRHFRDTRRMDKQDSQRSPGSPAAGSADARKATGQSEASSITVSAAGSSRKGLRDAARFWEPRRLLYNLALFGVVLDWVTKTWPHFRPAMTLESLGIMMVLALLANLCYCAGYLTEILIQNSTSSWNRQRWAVWVVGTLLAILFENYWIADEIYPFVR